MAICFADTAGRSVVTPQKVIEKVLGELVG